MAIATNSFAVTSTSSASDPLSASNAVTGYSTMQLVATAFSGVIQCQGSADGGVTYSALALVNMNDGTTIDGDTGVTAAGIYRADVGGVPLHRWKCSTFTSATAAVGYVSVREG